MHRDGILLRFGLALLATGVWAASATAQSEWITANFGIWDDPANWVGGVPDAPGDVAIFGTQTGEFVDVVINAAPVTVEEIAFIDSGFVSISGLQSLNLASFDGATIPRLFVDVSSESPFIDVELTGVEGLEKLGPSDLFINGPANYSGPTVVREGVLILGPSTQIQNGSIAVLQGAGLDVASHSSYSLAPGQELAGGGSVFAQELRIPSGIAINPGDGIGTLSVNGSVLLDAPGPVGAGLNFELTGDPIGANDLINISTDLSVFGNHLVQVAPVDNQLAPGNYALITYGGSLNIGLGSSIAVDPVFAANTRQTFQIDTAVPGVVTLGIGGLPEDLTWDGQPTNNNWDINNSVNWVNSGGGPDVFFDLDNVTFNDSATRFTVNVVQNVRPGSVRFDNAANDYSIVGSGSILGGAPLTVSGGGRVAMQINSEFSSVDVASGTLEVGTGGLVAAKANADIGPSGELRLNTGELRASQINVATGGQITGSGKIVGNTTIGEVVGSGTAVLSPGFSPGTIEIEGDLELENTAETVIEISGMSGNPHDLVAVTGNATLDGTLRLEAIDGYAVQANDQFTVVTSSSIVGGSVFQDVDPIRTGDMFLWPTYDGANVTLSVGMAGDMDLDGFVDENDISLFAFALRDNDAYDDALHPTGHEAADMSGNGRVDFGDISLFAEDVQASGNATAEQVAAAVLAAIAVPEPSSLGLMLAATAATGGCLRRRSKSYRADG